MGHINGLKSYKGRDEKELTQEELAEKYMPLALKIAGRARGRQTPYKTGLLVAVDYEGAALEGLWKGARNFDWERGVVPTTYFYHRVLGAVVDELRRAAPFTRRAMEMREKAESFCVKFFDANGRPPTDGEIARHLGTTVKKMYRSMPPILVSLYAPLPDYFDTEDTLATFLSDKKSEDPDAYLELVEEKEILKKALLALPRQERIVLTLYYFEDMNMEEIAEVLNVHESRASQIHGSGLLRLRKKMRMAENTKPPAGNDITLQEAIREYRHMVLYGGNGRKRTQSE